MCGIVGAVSGREVPAILMEGLQRLEYRGYDSAGIAVTGNGSAAIERWRTAGRVQELANDLKMQPIPRYHRHRPHPLGHPRPAGGGERPPAPVPRTHRRRTQRHHRELRGTARRAAGRRATYSSRKRIPRSSPISSTAASQRKRIFWKPSARRSRRWTALMPWE